MPCPGGELFLPILEVRKVVGPKRLQRLVSISVDNGHRGAQLGSTYLRSVDVRLLLRLVQYLLFLIKGHARKKVKKVVRVLVGDCAEEADDGLERVWDGLVAVASVV